MRWMRTIAAAAALLLVAGAAPPTPHWLPAWRASMWQAAEAQAPRLENVTIRSAVRVNAGGPSLRLRLANDYGPALTVGAATVRIAGGTPVRVTFGGGASATVPAGAPLVSDPIALPVKAFDVVEVSLYVPGPVTAATVHEAAGQPTDYSPPGDFTASGFTAVRTDKLRPLIAGLDILSSAPVVVAFGDSITDNGSCPNAAVPICRWSDVLARRMAAAHMPHIVVNHAISGNRVLSSGSSPSALSRFDRDVLSMPNVSHVVLLEGINDIGNSGREVNGATLPKITAAELIAGYRQLVARARDHGIKVIAMTILPFEGAFYYSPEREAMRVEVNQWIRTGHAFDAVIDMEKVVADPAHPTRLATNLQGGDNLHPDGRGETAMGQAIDLRLFR